MSEAATISSEGVQAVARRMVGTQRLKDAIANLTTQRDEANKRADKAEKAFADYQAKQDASPLNKQNAQLKQKLRDVEHRKTFDELAAEKGVTNKKAVDTLYEKSGWKADNDEFDADEMGATIDTALEEHSYLKTPAPNGQQNSATPKPGVGSGQGANGRRKPSIDPNIIEDDDWRMNDASWQAANWDKMVASSAAKRARGDFDAGKYKTIQLDESGAPPVDHSSVR